MAYMKLFMLSMLTMLLLSPAIYSLDADKPRQYQFKSKTLACFAPLVKETVKLSESLVRSLVDCSRRCAKELYCDRAVYRKYPDGKQMCTKLARAGMPDSAVSSVTPAQEELEKIFQKPDFSVCRVLEVNRCQNGGWSASGDNVCTCEDGYLGEFCEHKESYCGSRRNRLYSYDYSLQQGVTKRIMREYEPQGSENTAVVFDTTINAHVYTAGAKSYHGSFNLHVQTSASLELSSWDTIARPVRREFYLLGEGKSERVLIKSTQMTHVQLCERSSFGEQYAIDGLVFTRYGSPLPQEDKNKETSLEQMHKGHEVLDATRLALTSKHNVQYELTETLLRTSSSHENFVDPVTFDNLATIFGGSTVVIPTILGVEGPPGQSLKRPAQDLRFNPCWFKVLGDYPDTPEAVSYRKLVSALRKGHRVRIKTHALLYTIVDIRQDDDEVVFVTAPSTEKNLIQQKLLSTKGHWYSVQCEPETANLVKFLVLKPTSLSLFVDALKWSKVFEVDSDSRVIFGSVQDLVAHIEASADVRVWIRWSKVQKSRYLEINKRVVTDHRKKVSGLSVLSSQVDELRGANLTTTCGHETVLVTSEGAVNILRYDALTDGYLEALSDVVITWFVN